MTFPLRPREESEDDDIVRSDDRYQPIELPIARELLQVERERSERGHFLDAPIAVNTCKDCARLRDVIAELREIG